MPSAVAKNYLMAYNAAQLCVWGLIAGKLSQHFVTGGKLGEAYPAVKKLVLAGLSGAVLEILHAKFKLVKSSVGTTTIQVLMRLYVIAGAVEIGSKEVPVSNWAGQMVCAWTASEIIRYAFYLQNLVSGGASKSGLGKALTWLRYTAFIPLYPVGFTGEMGCFWTAIPFVKSTGKWSITMPNTQNFSFSYANWIYFLLFVVYPPGSWVMYSHMLSQRKKQLR